LFPVSRRGGNIPVETMSEPDSSLIAEFNARRSEDAFAALVRQHVHLVFATALRQVGDAGAAEEITQNVFVALAQAAGKLGSHPTIAGWLHQTALNKSREWLRSELRRRKREQAAVNLDLARAEGDSVWSPLVPLLDEALLELREPDRQAVILHFMEGRTFHEVGSALGVGEDAARKRVNRCLDQLTQFFHRHGFTTPAHTAGAPLFALSLHAAPAGLAASATTAGLAAAHSAASTSTLTLIKGALKIMAWTKANTAVAVGVAILLVGGTTFVAVTEVHKEFRSGAEPSYDGKTLSVWLRSFQHGLNGSPEQAKATAAVAHIGTNAIPTLLKLLRDPNSDSEKASAMYGFRILGNNGSAATPDLIRIYQQHISESSKAYAARSLGMIGPAAEAAVPYLLDSVTNTDAADPRDLQRFSAVEALGQIHADSETVVPALIPLVHSTNKGVAIVTVEALGKFGPSARDAIPVLLQVTNPLTGGWKPAYSASDAIRDIQGHYP
jgi:RNA polymerase sigma factor (sigma-70 family)